MGFDRTLLPDPPTFYENTGLRLAGRGKWRTTACAFHDGSDSMRINLQTGAFVCMAAQEVIEQRESNSDSAPYTLLKNYADRFKKYSAEEQYEIDFQHRLVNRNCYLDKYGDARINASYTQLEIKHSQPKNRASGKRVS